MSRKSPVRICLMSCSLVLLAVVCLCWVVSDPVSASNRDEASQSVSSQGIGRSADVPDLSHARWLILGPFPNEPSGEPFGNCLGFDTDYITEVGGESGVRPIEGTSTAGLVWMPLLADDGKVDFERLFPRRTESVAYAYLAFESECEQQVALRLGSDDGAKVWVNDELVWANHVHRALSPGQDVVRIDLKAGTNHMLVKVDQGEGEWVFTASLSSVEDEERRWSALPSRAVGIHLFEQGFADPSNIRCVPVTVPSTAARLPVQIIALSSSNDELCRTSAVTGERVALTLPAGYEGLFILKAACEDSGISDGSVAAMVGDSSELFGAAIDIARRRAAEMVPTPDRCEDVAATLTYLADVLEGRVHTSLASASQQLRAFVSISEICAALGSVPTPGQWHVGQLTGLRQWAYRSDIDGSLQPYCVYLPHGYDSSDKYGLIITLHGYTSNDYDAASSLAAQAPGDFIVVAPYGRGDMGYRSIGEQDVLDVLEMALRTYSIDPDRVYLTGSSMGGHGAWRIGALYSDRFAAIAPFCGWTSSSHLINLRNTPVMIVHGSSDTSVPVYFSRLAASTLKRLGFNFTYEELPGVGHNAWTGLIDHKGGDYLFDYFRKHTLVHWPTDVFLITGYVRHGKQHWVQMEELTAGASGMILAAVRDGAIVISTSGVNAFSLDLRHPSLAGYESVRVRVDDTILDVEPGSPRVIFAKAGERWVETAEDLPPTTVRRLGGGLADLFMGPVVFVYGTGDPDRTPILRRAAELYADWSPTTTITVGSKAGRFEVVADSEVDEEDLAGKNILLFGNPRENRILAELAEGLPVSFTDDGDFEFAGERFQRDALFMVYPNPKSPANLLGVITLPFGQRFVESYFATANRGFRAYSIDESSVESYITPDVLIYDSFYAEPRMWFFDRLWQHPTELRR